MRHKILELLLERAATVNQLAEALDHPTSTIAHHVRVLTEAGLTKVVRTPQVRAITERYYGCVARHLVSITNMQGIQKTIGVQLLEQVLKEITTNESPSQQFLSTIFSHARISQKQALAFVEKINQLTQEFEAMSIPGEQAYEFLAALYQTNLPELSEETGEQ